MMRKICIILFLINFILTFCQRGKDNYFPPSPESSSLIKYVDVPVNYSTGIINYSLPIHNIKLKNLDIPISLSYQSSGCKPSEIASNVGLGWELNVGGKITQNVIGQNDLNVSGPNNSYWNLPNNRDFKLPQEKPEYYQTTGSPYNLDSLGQSNTDYFMFSQIDKNKLETQPDLFYYSTPNKSGKFFFAYNYETKQVPFGKEKILYNQSNRTFEITDTFGVRYLYNVYTENINSTLSTSALEKLNGNSTNKSYTFYLTQIITPSNESVDFIYDTVKYNLSNDKDYTRYYHTFYGGTEKVTSYFSEINNKVLKSIKVNGREQIIFNYIKYRKDIKGINQTNSPKTLDEIIIKDSKDINKYNLEYGYFGINDNSYNSNIFESSLNNEDTFFRLKLKQIKKDNENPYIFNYYNESSIDRFSSLDHWGYLSNSSSRYTMNILFGDFNTNTKLPNLELTKTNVLKNIVMPTKGEVEFDYELNDCKDCDITYPEFYWDSFDVYSNADDNLSNQLESHEITFTVPEKYESVPVVKYYIQDNSPSTVTNYVSVHLYDSQNRPIDFLLSGGSGIQTMPYQGNPLEKGKTYKLVLQCYDNAENENKFLSIKFLNSYNNIHNNGVVGGLRIKEINTKDSNSVIHRRIFDYKDNNVSSGILYEKPYYFDEYSYFVEKVSEQQTGPELGFFRYIVQYSRIPSDLFGFNGYHIYYQKVSENKQDTNDVNNKIKIEKYFTFHDDLRYGDDMYFSKISYNWKRGLESQINEYKGDDVVRKTTFFYSFLDTPASLVPSIEVGNHLSNPTFPNEFHQRSLDLTLRIKSDNFYNIYSYRSSKLISAWYYLNKKITEENLNGKILKKEEEFIYSNPTNAQLTKTKISLPDSTIQETTYQYANEKGNQYLIDKNMVGIPLQTTVSKNNLGISSVETKYPLSQTDADAKTNGLALPTSVISYGLQIPGASSSSKTEVTYDKYDDKGNILQYTVKGLQPTVIIWGYNQTQPIVKIEGKSYDALMALSGVSTLVNYAITKSNSDVDTATEQLLLTALDSLRTDSSLNAYMISTYTYDPLIGVTSITPPSGIREIYKYDSANRLQSVVDVNGKILKEYQYNYKQ